MPQFSNKTTTYISGNVFVANLGSIKKINTYKHNKSIYIYIYIYINAT